MTASSVHLNEESSVRYPGWGVLAAAFTGVMVSFAPIVPYTFSLFLDPLHAAFGWKREAMGGAFALAAITVALVSPLIGLLLDRFPPRRVILPAIVVFAVGLATLSQLTPNIVQFYATFFVIGLVANATAQFAYTRTILTWFTKRQRICVGPAAYWQRNWFDPDSAAHGMDDPASRLAQRLSIAGRYRDSGLSPHRHLSAQSPRSSDPSPRTSH